MIKRAPRISITVFLLAYWLILPVIYANVPNIGNNMQLRALIQMVISVFIILINCHFIFQTKEIGKTIGKGILYGIITFILALMVNGFIVKLIPMVVIDNKALLTQVNPTMSLISGVVLGPICEELVFRRHLYNWIDIHVKNQIYSTLIVSILFAVTHCMTWIYMGQWQSMWQILLYLIPGIIFQIACNKEDVRTSAVAHMLYNFLAG